MEGGFIGGAIGGLVGAVMATLSVTRLNAKLRERACPGCGQPLSKSKTRLQTFKQMMWGGLICGSCRCDVDRHGKERVR
jgi:hypothetical protein